jgi:nucleoside-diphosphate-sugar epimerase
MTREPLAWPDAVHDEDELEELLSRPSASDVEFLAGMPGDVVILGAGGKMGPSLARRVKRAADASGVPRRVTAVSRFSSAAVAESLREDGVAVIACDLLDPGAVERLPDAPNVLFLAGMKFGATADPGLTWALNTVVPGHVARRYRGSRTVVFSTGNVYPLVDPDSGGCTEADATGPVGEYAQSCLGRERVFEHYSHEHGTPCLLFRLFYAVDLRYGTLVDVAHRVHAGQPVDLAVPCFNAIWQGDALSYAIRSLALAESPPRALNVTGEHAIPLRAAAAHFARLFGKEPRFSGEEGRLALLGDARECHRLLGPPEVSTDRLVAWVADWVARGGRTLGKPTGFEKSDGRF